MTWAQFFLTVGVSVVTSLLVSLRGHLRYLLVRTRTRPVDPERLQQILAGSMRTATNGSKSTGTPPSASSPPVQ